MPGLTFSEEWRVVVITGLQWCYQKFKPMLVSFAGKWRG